MICWQIVDIFLQIRHQLIKLSNVLFVFVVNKCLFGPNVMFVACLIFLFRQTMFAKLGDGASGLDERSYEAGTSSIATTWPRRPSTSRPRRPRC